MLSRVRLIWRIMGSQPYKGHSGLWLDPFLEAVRYCSAKLGGILVYIVYQIWLFRNSLVFEVEIVFMQWVLERAIYLAIEYCHFDIVTISLRAPKSWTPILSRQRSEALFSFLESPLLLSLSRWTLIATLGVPQVMLGMSSEVRAIIYWWWEVLDFLSLPS